MLKASARNGVTFLAFLTATVTSYFVSSDQEAVKERELAEREASDRELKELLQRLDGRLAAVESKLERNDAPRSD